VLQVNILRELRHPHIVRYLDRVIDKQATKIYIVMEYCEGGDLGQFIKRKKREGYATLPIPRAASCIISFLEILSRRF
jgi:serine/threonine protein kinase